MKNYKKFEVGLDEYEQIKRVQLQNGSDVREHSHGSRKKLFVLNKLVAAHAHTSNLDLGDLNQKQFVSFLGTFNKHLYAKFLKQPELYNLDITFSGIAREKNAGFWHSLKKGTYFYNVDLSSAYWQIAHKLGYISTKFFEDYQNVDSYKQAKRYCISFLARTNKTMFRMPNAEYEIHCDNSVLQKVYDNIRNELYNCVQKSIFNVSDWLEYNIDGVTVMSDNLDAVCEEFKGMGLAFKITECRKVSETEYTYGSKLRVFTNKNQNTEVI
jgi:hypothetical protein